MFKTVIGVAAALAISTAASAEPLKLTNSQMDNVTAGFFTTPGGNVIFGNNEDKQFVANQAGRSGKTPASKSSHGLPGLWNVLKGAGKNPLGPTHNVVQPQ
jgi:hypothetical protein